MQIRTNGSVGPPTASPKRSTSDKPKLLEAQISEGIRLVQREDSETNQTFFCEVPVRRTSSSIPVKPKNSPRSNGPKTAHIGLSFSPEKFILRQDQPADHRTPMRRLPPNPMTPLEPTYQRSDELPRPLNRFAIQDRDGKASSHAKSSVTRYNKSAELKRLNQVAQDKHWPQCAKTNSNRITGHRSSEAQNNDVGRETKTRHDKTSHRKSGMAVHLAKHQNKTNESYCVEERDEFKLISRQLDKLSASENRQ